MRRERKKRLTQKDLKALGTTPGLVLRRIPPAGRKKFAAKADTADEERRQA
ncbi:MAG: hypothetical protein M3N18_01420 [Actinomycetota bacterium]|nr:hypothetical protein [Actinomycetota bacterium]